MCDRTRSLNVHRAFADAWTKLATSTSRKSVKWPRSLKLISVCRENSRTQCEWLGVGSRWNTRRAWTRYSNCSAVDTGVSPSQVNISVRLPWQWTSFSVISSSEDHYLRSSWSGIRQNCSWTREIVDDEQLQIGNADQCSQQINQPLKRNDQVQKPFAIRPTNSASLFSWSLISFDWELSRSSVRNSRREGFSRNNVS